MREYYSLKQLAALTRHEAIETPDTWYFRRRIVLDDHLLGYLCTSSREALEGATNDPKRTGRRPKHQWWWLNPSGLTLEGWDGGAEPIVVRYDATASLHGLVGWCRNNVAGYSLPPTYFQGPDFRELEGTIRGHRPNIRLGYRARRLLAARNPNPPTAAPLNPFPEKWKALFLIGGALDLYADGDGLLALANAEREAERYGKPGREAARYLLEEIVREVRFGGR